MSTPIMQILHNIEKTADKLNFTTGRRHRKETNNEITRLDTYLECLKLLLPTQFVTETFPHFDRHLSFMKHFYKEKNFPWIKNNLDDIRKEDLPYIKASIYGLIDRNKNIVNSKKTELSNKIFIVHGRDYKPMRELKKELSSLGLEPIILHEKASGSRTIIEKLERYSDVGYAFVILTPDDRGGLFKGNLFGGWKLEKSGFRARQNAILEFGYFAGRLGRDRVCCLYKGDVELPSDMHGITYIQFSESVKEIWNQIIRELRAVGYNFSERVIKKH